MDSHVNREYDVQKSISQLFMLLRESPDYVTAFHYLVTELERLLDVDSFFVWVVEDNTLRCKMRFSAAGSKGCSAEEKDGVSLKSTTSLYVKAVLENKTMVFTSSTQSKQDPKRNLLYPCAALGQKLLLQVELKKSTEEQLQEDEVKSYLRTCMPTLAQMYFYLEKLEQINAENEYNEFVKRISSSSDLEYVLSQLLGQLKKSIAFDGSLVVISDSSNERLVCEAVKLPPKYAALEQSYLKTTFPITSHDAMTQCFNENKVVHVKRENTSQFHGATTELFALFQIREAVCCPIRVSDKSVGVIVIFTQTGALSESQIESVVNELAILRAKLANVLSVVTLTNQEVEVVNAANVYTRLLSVVNETNRCQSTHEVYETILSNIIRIYGFDLGVLFRCQKASLTAEAQMPVSDKYRKKSEYLKTWLNENPPLLEEKHNRIVASLLSNEVELHVEESRVKPINASKWEKSIAAILERQESVAFVPIYLNGKPLGLIWLVSIDHRVTVSKEGISLLKAISAYFGTAIRNSETFSTIEKQKAEIQTLNVSLKAKIVELESLSKNDQLTDLYNYAYLVEELERRINEAQRYTDANFALILIGIDRFQRFIERNGEESSNQIVRSISEVLKSKVAATDVVCRYANSQFACLCPNVKLEDAIDRAKKIIQYIARDPFMTDDGIHDISASASVLVYENQKQVTSILADLERTLKTASDPGNRVLKFAQAMPELTVVN